jgi:hypothetical protein
LTNCKKILQPNCILICFNTIDRTKREKIGYHHKKETPDSILEKIFIAVSHTVAICISLWIFGPKNLELAHDAIIVVFLQFHLSQLFSLLLLSRALLLLMCQFFEEFVVNSYAAS